MMSFLPQAPRQLVAATVAVKAPQVKTNLSLAETPSYLKPEIIAPPTEADLRIRRAEERFQSGKKAYLNGDSEAARSDFDRAVDILLSTPETLPDRIRVEAKLEQIIASIHRYDVNGMGAGDLSGQVSYDKAPLEEILELTFPVDPSLKPKVKEQLQATVSQLPLEMNDAVLSYINYFSGEKGRRTLLAGLRRAGKYKPLISRILAEEGVPQELIYLAQAESGFLPRAVSNKAAVGMWQFIQSRGRQYGLNQTTHTDDRLDPEKATRSAARHLRDLYSKFGDWYLAVAGYNCGDGCIERAVQRTGYADFWLLRSRNAIPRETTNYVPIILAMTIMHKNAKDYGLENIELDSPLLYDSFRADAPTHLALVSDAASVPLSELRDLNPALLTSVAPAGFELRVPNGTKPVVLGHLESIPFDKRASWRIHRVSEGDTIESIARHYQMPVSTITALNESASADVGDVLVIPTQTQLERVKVASKTRAKAGSRLTGKTVVKKSSSRLARNAGSLKKKAPARVQLKQVAAARRR